MDAYIALGYACNHRCLCCPLTTYDRLHGKMEPNVINAKIDRILEANKSGPCNIVLSGGEPFLHPNMLQVMRKLLESDCNVTVLTNATQLSTSDTQKELLKLLNENPNRRKQLRFVTAIHSSNNELHDRITGCNGSLWDTLVGLDYCVEHNLTITIKIILSKLNIPTLLDTVKYIDEHFPPLVKIQFCGMDYSGQAEKNRNELLISFHEIQPFLEKAIDYLEERNRKRIERGFPCRSVSILELPLCLSDPFYWKYYVIPSDKRTLYAAPNDNSTDLSSISFADVQCGTFYEECDNCCVRSLCYGTWRTTYRYICQNLRPIVSAES